MKTLPITITFMLLTIFAFGQDTTTVMAIDSGARFDENIITRQTERLIAREKFSSYPKLPTVSKPLDGFIPAKWKVRDSVYSDLNFDKIADLSLVLQYKDTVIEMMPDNWEWENVPRMLVLLFKNSQKNEYKLALQNNHIIPRAGTGKQGGDPFDGLQVKNNTITIGGEMGGEYSFRFQNGDFYLISAWTNGIMSPKKRYNSYGAYNYDTFYYYELDFLKSEALSKKTLMDDNEGKEMRQKFPIAKRPLIRLRNLKEFDERRIFKGLIK